MPVSFIFVVPISVLENVMLPHAKKLAEKSLAEIEHRRYAKLNNVGHRKVWPNQRVQRISGWGKNNRVANSESVK